MALVGASVDAMVGHTTSAMRLSEAIILATSMTFPPPTAMMTSAEPMRAETSSMDRWLISPSKSTVW